jgi:hypothetical protein
VRSRRNHLEDGKEGKKTYSARDVDIDTRLKKGTQKFTMITFTCCMQWREAPLGVLQVRQGTVIVRGVTAPYLLQRYQHHDSEDTPLSLQIQDDKCSEVEFHHTVRSEEGLIEACSHCLSPKDPTPPLSCIDEEDESLQRDKHSRFLSHGSVDEQKKRKEKKKSVDDRLISQCVWQDILGTYQKKDQEHEPIEMSEHHFFFHY